MKNKKASHVGIILSFVVFVTFVIFILSILEPKIKTNPDKEAFLESLKIKFVDEISSNLSITSISVTVTDTECDLLSINLGELDNLYALVKDKDGIVVGSKNKIESELKIDWDNVDDFFRVYSSEEELSDYLNNNLINCAGVDATISSIREEEYIFEDKTKDIITNKRFENLNIPNGTGFDVTFEDAEQTITGNKEKPSDSISVYSDRFSVQYFDKNTDIKTGFITIRVW